MPLIEVKAVDRRFDDPATNERLIATLTDAACQVWGEEARPQIWVVLEGVPPGRWCCRSPPSGCSPAWTPPDRWAEPVSGGPAHDAGARPATTGSRAAKRRRADVSLSEMILRPVKRGR